MSGNVDDKNIEKPPRPTSWRLSMAALTLWLLSLFLPGIILSPAGSNLTGVEILLEGWLSPIAANFAWFANPLFLIAVFKIMSGKPAPALALTAAVLGFDSFRFSELPSSVSMHPVYGLGWGAVVWLAALLLMMSAAGARQYEIRSSIWWKDRGFEWLKPLGMVSLVVLLAVTAYFAAYGRWNPQALGQPQIPLGLAFKR